MIKGYLTAKEAAKELGLKENTLYIYRHFKRPPHGIKFGWTVLYSMKEIKRYKIIRARARTTSNAISQKK